MQVIDILTSNVELMDLIKKVDNVFHSKTAAEPSKSMLTGLNRYIPTIRKQLQVFYLFVFVSFSLNLYHFPRK